MTGRLIAERSAGRFVYIIYPMMEVLLTALALALAGCAQAGQADLRQASSDAPACEVERLELPDAIGIWDMRFDAETGELELLGASPVSSATVSGEEDSCILWRSSDGGITWEAAGALSPEDAEAGLILWMGAINPWGGYLAYLGPMVANSMEEVAEREKTYIFSADGTRRLLDGLEDISFDGMLKGIWFSESILFLTGFADEGGGFHRVHCYLIDVGRQQVLADIPCEGEIGTYCDCAQVSADACIVVGTEGMLLLDSSTGEVLEPSEELAAFVDEGRKGDAYDGATLRLAYDDGILYSLNMAELRSFDTGSLRAGDVLSFDAAAFGGGNFNPLGFVPAGDGSFFVLYTDMSSFGGGLMRVRAAEGADAREPLGIYTLERNDAVTQAAILFEEENPGFRCDIEVGMEDGSAATKEDAVRALNARVLAGEGPDVLVLDGLPVEDYLEKGLLADLGDAGAGDAFFEGVTRSFARADGAVRAVPTRFYLLAMQGDPSFLEGASAREGVSGFLAGHAEAGLIEGAYAVPQNPDADKLATYVGFLYDAASCGLVAGGEASEQAIAAFMGDCGRIRGTFGCGRIEAPNVFMRSILEDDWDIVFSGEGAGIGAVCSENDIAIMTQLEKEHPSLGWSLCFGDGMAFCPDTVIGISAGAAHPDEACAFLDALLSEDQQAVRVMMGYPLLPVQKDAFARRLAGEAWGDETDFLFDIGSEETGSVLVVDRMSPEEIQGCIEEIDSADLVPMNADAVIRETVMGNLQKYLDGDLTLDEAVAASKQKIDLYLAE